MRDVDAPHGGAPHPTSRAPAGAGALAVAVGLAVALALALGLGLTVGLAVAGAPTRAGAEPARPAAGRVLTGEVTTTTTTTTTSTTSTTTRAGAPSQAAMAAVVSQAVAWALAQRSVRVTAVARKHGRMSRQTIDIGPDGGTETATEGGQTVRMELLGHTVYLRGGATGLRALLNLPRVEAAAYAGRWLSSNASATGVGQMAEVFSLRTWMDSLVDVRGPWSWAGPGSGPAGPGSGRTTTLRIVGKLPATPIDTGAGAGARAELTVTGSAPYQPVSVTFTVPDFGTCTVEFSGWGERVHVPVPTGAVPLQKVALGG